MFVFSITLSNFTPTTNNLIEKRRKLIEESMNTTEMIISFPGSSFLT
ncbi:hypothetical protein AALP_AAs41748U000100 [Arabis alpina]|uniref:Uncharacterized protein n=1 Tax=Arabis alpina TaxID=50452 RepID=A0A087FWX1_ARAAL|nr:hypothetical protein AALP_AAs41748U000100 [Arabis alpina]